MVILSDLLDIFTIPSPICYDDFIVHLSFIFVLFFSLLFQLQLNLTVIADDDDHSRTLGPLCYTH